MKPIDTAIGERHLTPDIGGEAGAEIERLKKRQRIRCHGVCLKTTSTDDIRGYPHDGGLADEAGTKWWVYVSCSNKVTRDGKPSTCDYDTSWQKVRRVSEEE